MKNHADNGEVSGIPEHPYEDYITGNILKGEVPTTSNMIDLKWPNCHTGTKQILDNFTAMSSSRHEGSLAQTVSERWSKEERWFVGRSQQD